MAERSIVYTLSANITQFKAQMAQASASVKGAADKMTGATKEGAKFRAGLDTLGGAAAKVGLVAAAGLGAAIYAAANFDASMSKVQAATGESAASMDKLREAAIQAGADTAFSASEAAAGIENLAKAGVSTADILGGGLTGALDLAAAGELDVATAAEAAATAMTQFKLSGEDVPHIADLLAAGAGKAQGEVTDLSAALNQSGLVAGQMGLSIEETTGSLAAFASAGLLGSDAGTSLKTMLLRLANPSKEAAETMADLGINAYDANGNLVSMSNLAGQLSTAFEGQTQAQRDSALATIFGSDAIRAANVLYSQGADGISDWTNRVDDSGFAAEQAATKLDNLKGDLEAFKGSLETALIGTGDGAQGPLRSLVQNATDAVNAFNDLPPAAQSATASLLGITAVTGGGLWLGSAVIGKIAATRVALGQLGISATTTGIAMKGMAAGLGISAALVGFAALDRALDSILDKNLNDSDLPRQIEALAGGEVVGNLAEVSKWVGLIANDGANIGTDHLFSMLPGVTGSFEEAAAELEKIDQVLAGLVDSGDTETAAAAFEMIAELTGDAGLSAKDTAAAFDSYALALKNLNGPSQNTTDAANLLLAPLGLVADATAASGVAANKAAERQKEHAKALRASRNAAGETASEFISLGDSFDDAKVSLNGWIKQLASQADALRNFRVNAEKAADKGLRQGLIDALEEMGPAGALRLRQLANATDSQIARANAAWRRLQGEAGLYIDIIGGVPKAVETDVQLNGVSTAMAALYALNRIKLDDKTITIHTVRVGGDGAFLSGGAGADGMTIPGPRQPYGDKTLILAAPGEELITNRNGEADQFRADRTAGRIPAYADGGRVGADYYDRLNAQRFAVGGTVSYSPPAAPVNQRDLAGLRIEGRIETTGPNEGYLRGVIAQEIEADGKFSKAHRR